MSNVAETKNFTLYNFEDPEYYYFEHNELGDECGGGLWFEGRELIDYDGVYALPREVVSMLKDLGFDVSYVEED